MKRLNYVNVSLLSLRRTKNVNFVRNTLITARLVIKKTVNLVKMDSVSMKTRRNVSVLMTEILMRRQDLVKRKQDWVHWQLLRLLLVFWPLLEQVNFWLYFSCCFNKVFQEETIAFRRWRIRSIGRKGQMISYFMIFLSTYLFHLKIWQNK